MLRSAFLSAVLLAGFVGSAVAQSDFDPRPRFDGTVKITRLVGASCQDGQQGQTYQAAFAAKINPTARAPETMTIVVPTLAGALYLRAEGNGTFVGANQVASGIFVFDATRGALPNAQLNLDFNPNAVTGTTPSFTFLGTVRSFLAPGCTATVRGNFTRREIP
jgi:hypothetical protein